MNSNSRAFARNMFRLRIHESDGQAYEDLFVRIMGYAKPRFRPVRAHGNIGDRKNDGYESKSGTYYQVYAPEDVRKNQGDALRKIRRDFKGLKAFWDGIFSVRKYFFVINDKYQGVSPAIEKEIASIGSKHKLDDCDVLLAKDLEEILFSLSDDVVISVVGHVPVLEPSEFMFLSGFTYFVGAWVEFEKTMRRILTSVQPAIRLPLGALQMIRVMEERSILSKDECLIVDALRKRRNLLIHGDDNELPRKEEIDRLVSITEALRNESAMTRLVRT